MGSLKSSLCPSPPKKQKQKKEGKKGKRTQHAKWHRENLRAGHEGVTALIYVMRGAVKLIIRMTPWAAKKVTPKQLQRRTTQYSVGNEEFAFIWGTLRGLGRILTARCEKHADCIGYCTKLCFFRWKRVALKLSYITFSGAVWEMSLVWNLWLQQPIDILGSERKMHRCGFPCQPSPHSLCHLMAQ